MAPRVCTQPGCPAIVDTGRCPRHRRELDRARGSRQERGYGAAHDHVRATYQDRMNRGETFTCWRCGRADVDPASWHLGHCDDDRRAYHGPEHPACNTATAGRAGAACPHGLHASRQSNGVG